VQKKRRETWGGAGASIAADDSTDGDIGFVAVARGRSLHIG